MARTTNNALHQDWIYMSERMAKVETKVEDIRIDVSEVKTDLKTFINTAPEIFAHKVEVDEKFRDLKNHVDEKTSDLKTDVTWNKEKIINLLIRVGVITTLVLGTYGATKILGL